MWSNILNKLEQNGPFKTDRSKIMDVPVEYDNEVEFQNTHPNLLPEEDRVLGITGINGYRIPSRSVLGDLSNRFMLGILRNSKKARNISKDVTWAEVTVGKVQGTKT